MGSSPYSFTRRTDGAGNLVYAAHINELQQALEDHPMVPRLTTGYIYSPATIYGGQSNTALVANVLRAAPLWIPKEGFTVTHARVTVNTGSAGNRRFGAYHANQSTGYPDALLVELTASGAVNVTDTGTTTFDLSSSPLSVERIGDDYPFLWLADLGDSTPTMFSVGGYAALSPVLGGHATAALGVGVVVSRSLAYTALPDPFGSSAIGNGIVAGQIVLQIG